MTGPCGSRDQVRRQLATTPAYANYAKANSQPPDRFSSELIAAARGIFGMKRPDPEPQPFEHSHIPAKEAPPRSRPQVVSRGFRASLVQPSVSLRPFPLRSKGWAIPHHLRLLPPAFARRHSGISEKCLPKTTL